VTEPRTRPAPTPDAGASLTFLDPSGETRTWQVRHDGEVAAGAAGLRSRRLLTVAGGHSIVQRWAPAVRAGGQPGYGLLENEVRAGVRLAARYPVQYPPELPRLIGYDLDVAEPFVLLAPPRGEPCTAVAGRLHLDPLRAFQVGLFRGVLLLAEAGLAHGQLSPENVRWDQAAEQVQLDGFSWCTAIGEPRPPGPAGACASPQQRAGAGAALAADDVWSAGLVVYQVATGRDVSSQAGPPELASRGAALRSVLAGVFTESPADRPTAADLLRRLGHRPLVPTGPDETAGLAEGRQEFDRLLREKWPPPNAFPPRRPPPGRWRTVALAALVGCLLLAAGYLAVRGLR
jgi:hypothetical protein